ncbi:hypothetical protein B0T17DRAFT_599542 [Bombardia bombarda]|uniref:Uncharacterized protein n=1 Tax=Bombardia bombarda TaxID=252184 RepID=A0AA40C5D9_9PEZI|nr:hypothetical protein B0T17DRAFT_599542 [Bombardia bombarda]
MSAPMEHLNYDDDGENHRHRSKSPIVRLGAGSFAQQTQDFKDAIPHILYISKCPENMQVVDKLKAAVDHDIRRMTTLRITRHVDIPMLGTIFATAIDMVMDDYENRIADVKTQLAVDIEKRFAVSRKRSLELEDGEIQEISQYNTSTATTRAVSQESSHGDCLILEDTTTSSPANKRAKVGEDHISPAQRAIVQRPQECHCSWMTELCVNPVEQIRKQTEQALFAAVDAAGVTADASNAYGSQPNDICRVAVAFKAATTKVDSVRKGVIISCPSCGQLAQDA